MVLSPCPACKRHVFRHEIACPHCGDSSSSFVSAVALAAALTVACGSGDEAKPGASAETKSAKATSSATVGAPPSQAQTVYGPAPVDPSTRTSSSASGAPATSAAPSADPSAGKK